MCWALNHQNIIEIAQGHIFLSEPLALIKPFHEHLGLVHLLESEVNVRNP
jgi:hypothetical protein